MKFLSLFEGSPWYSPSLVKTDWEDEYQNTVSKYEEMVLNGPEFQKGLQRLATIGATTGDVYDLLAPLTPERCPDLHKQYPSGNGPITPMTALMSRIRDSLEEMPHQDVHHHEQPGAVEREHENTFWGPSYPGYVGPWKAEPSTYSKLSNS